MLYNNIISRHFILEKLLYILDNKYFNKDSRSHFFIHCHFPYPPVIESSNDEPVGLVKQI